ncbi:hypothetical protein [Flavobacterium rhizosphaerae]|uniref:Lipoprotein n=1 Tax=Flavobacterium rhizosphaerae TaxID=3163298 RepID=A0ABW8YXC8_9FLAO
MKKLLIILLVMASGCSSKKEVSRHTETAARYKMTDTASETSVVKLQNQSFDTETLQEYQFTDMEYDGCEGDSLVFTEYGPTGIVRELVFKGSGKIKASSGGKKESGTTQSQGTVIQENKTASSGTEVASSEAYSESLDKKVERTTSFFSWLWLLLLLVIIAVAWYLNKRFGWLIKLKNHVTEFLSR